jgi:hypothetical protein
MNLDLPTITSAGDVAHLLWLGLAHALQMILTTWWGPTVTVTLLLLTVIANVHDGGFADADTDPVLTEAQRGERS